MQRPKPIFLVVLLACAAGLSATSAAGAASGPQIFTGTIVTDVAGGDRHIVKSIVIAHGAFNGVGTIVEVPNQPGDGEDIFRDDLVFAQGTLHLVTTNVDIAFNVIALSCRFTASVQQRGRIAGGTGLFTQASGSGAGGVVARGTAVRTADGSCDPSAATPHEVDRISSMGTLFERSAATLREAACGIGVSSAMAGRG
jgi:hypothetical protein